jgi:hypothetical protein
MNLSDCISEVSKDLKLSEGGGGAKREPPPPQSKTFSVVPAGLILPTALFDTMPNLKDMHSQVYIPSWLLFIADCFQSSATATKARARSGG